MQGKINHLLSKGNQEPLSAYLKTSNPLPENMKDWFAQLALLYGVPFNNLVPNEKMLPNESLRFFYLDKNWLKALIVGALSIGVHSSKDEQVQKMMLDKILEDAYHNLLNLRKKLRKEPISEERTGHLVAGSLSGMLLRSQLVSGWQGLEVKAYSDNQDQLTLLRMERLASNIMIVIFEGIPNKVEILEPSECLSFGFSDEHTIRLRDLTEKKGPIGTPITTDKGQTKIEIKEDYFFYRNPRKRVLNIINIKERLEEVHDDIDSISPAGLAVHLIRRPLKQVFSNEYISQKTVDRSPIAPKTIDKEMIYNAFFGE